MDSMTAAAGVEVVTSPETSLAYAGPGVAGDGKRPRGRPRGTGQSILVTVSLTRRTLQLLDAISARDIPPKRPGVKNQGRSATLRRLVVEEAELRDMLC